MALVSFTPQLRRFVDVPHDAPTNAATLRDALDDVFARHPRLRGYVLDDQGHLRANVVIFIDGRRSNDRTQLAEPLEPASRVYVMQALSGG